MKAPKRTVFGRNRYCGPYVVAAVLGITTDRAASLLRAQRRPQDRHRPITYVKMRWVYDVLNAHGVKPHRVGWFLKQHQNTLGGWLLGVAPYDKAVGTRMVVLGISGHTLLYHNGRMLDNNTRSWVWVRDFALNRTKKYLSQPMEAWHALKDETVPVLRKKRR